MNISILTIATGKYIDFIPDLIKSSEENFLKKHKKTYYIFTDSELDIKIKGVNIVKIYQEKLGWPYDTMMRFHMFLSIEKEIKNTDFTFFLNANMKFLNEVSEEVFPSRKNSFFTGVKHPGFFKSDISQMPYEKRKGSNFYVSEEKNKNRMYYQGCFNGGTTSKWIKMCKLLSNKIDEDLRSNIIPIWHDESAINWYFSNIEINSLEPNYALPEQILDDDFSEKHSYSLLKKLKPYSIQRDKRKYGGSDELRK
jgi:hypothetical protein